MNEIAARHAALADHFGRLADNVVDWDAPTPVTEWSTRDIVDHLTSWLPGLLERYGVPLDTVPVGADPARAWREHSANVQRLLDDEELALRDVETHQGPQTLGQVIDSFYSTDVFMHTWDLAVSSGQDADLDPLAVRNLVDGLAPIVDVLAESGQYGTPVVLDETRTALDRMVALIGRDPNWQA